MQNVLDKAPYICRHLQPSMELEHNSISTQGTQALACFQPHLELPCNIVPATCSQNRASGGKAVKDLLSKAQEYEQQLDVRNAIKAYEVKHQFMSKSWLALLDVHGTAGKSAGGQSKISLKHS